MSQPEKKSTTQKKKTTKNIVSKIVFGGDEEKPIFSLFCNTKDVKLRPYHITVVSQQRTTKLSLQRQVDCL